MTRRVLLSRKQLKKALTSIPGWKVVRGKLHREYRFASFIEAFGFMTKVAILAESMNHHPEWSNVYDTVKVDLMTHDLSGISSLDVILAQRMDELSQSPL